MCFCILTANFNAERTIKIQNEIGECFLRDTKEELSKKLKDYGHRFPNNRAEYITDSKKCKDRLNEVVKFHDKKKIREWIVNNVKGLGYKEASHFLRNIGVFGFAILDRHVLKNLVAEGVISEIPSLTRKNYLLIESKFKNYAESKDLSVEELDLLFWSKETGQVFK